MDVFLMFSNGSLKSLPVNIAQQPILLPRIHDVIRINNVEWRVCKVLWDVDKGEIYVMVI